MKTTIALIFGGRSVEHEVSVITALQAKESLDSGKYQVIPVYIAKSGEMYTGEAVGDIGSYRDIPGMLRKAERCSFQRQDNKVWLVKCPAKRFGTSVISRVDAALPAVHGTNSEDGTLQGYLHMLGLPYAGCDILASAVGMDKYFQKCVLRAAGVPVLDGVTIRAKLYTVEKNQVIERIEAISPYPVIIKPVNLGSSVGIKVASDRSELASALDHAFLFADEVIAERALTKLREFNVSVLGETDDCAASEVEEPIARDKILSYEDKYTRGGKGKGGKNSGAKSAGGMAGLDRQIPAIITKELREEIRETGIKAFKALKCAGVARCDFLYDTAEQQIYFNEINTIPGSLAFYLWKAVGVDYPALLDKMIQLAFKRVRDDAAINFTFDTNILQNVNFGGNNTNNKLK